MEPKTLHPPVDGSAVEARRRRLGFSREALGAAAGGISSSTIRRLERGEGVPYRSTATAIAHALGCELGEVFPIYDHQALIGPSNDNAPTDAVGAC